MADKSLDKRTRQIDQTGIRNGNEFELMQKAQNQFMAIQAERKQNLDQQRTIMGMEQQQNAILTQGAQIAAVDDSRDMGIPQTVDPRTQTILNRYGMGKPRFQTSTARSQQVTKQNVVIHNTTNNNTTNNVVAGGYGGPVMGRELAFRKSNNDSAEKFKVWLANSYARQQQQAVVRNREYEKREDNLIRSENKMMRKLEGISKSVTKILNPRTIGSTLVNPLKMLFMFMGFHLFIRNWKALMQTMRKVENFLEGTAEHFGFSLRGGKVSFNKDKFTSEVDKKLGPVGAQMVKAFGGNPYRGDTIGTVLKRIIIGDSQNYGLWEQMKDYFKDKFSERSQAIKNFPAPNVGRYIKENNYVGAIGELAGYLGNIMSIALGGSSAIGKISLDQSYKKDFEDLDNSAESRRFRTIEKGNTVSKTAQTSRANFLRDRLENSLKTLSKPNKNASSSSDIETFLGEDKLNIFTGLGLTPVANEEDKDSRLRQLRFRDESTGNEFVVKFRKDGSIDRYMGPHDTGFNSIFFSWDSASASSPITGKWYAGDLITKTKNNQITGTGLSSFNLSLDGKELKGGELNSFRQMRNLDAIIKQAKNGKVDEVGFAKGMDRLRKYINGRDNGDSVTVDKSALMSIFNLNEQDIKAAVNDGSIVVKNFYTIKRKITLMELLAINHKKDPAIAGLEAGLNAYIHTYGEYGFYTGLKDYLPSQNSLLGYYILKHGSQKGLTAAANKKLVKLGAKKGVEDAVVKRAQSIAAKKIAGRFATRFIPYVGWGLLAWDVIDVLKNYAMHRNEFSAAIINYEKALDAIKNLPKFIGDVVSEEELEVMIDADENCKTIANRCFDVHLVNATTKETLAGFNDKNLSQARIPLYTINVAYLKSLFSAAGINGEVGDLEDFVPLGEEGDSLDFSHRITDYLHKNLLGNTSYSSATDPSFWAKNYTGENSELFELEKKNERKREAKRMASEAEKTYAKNAVDQDEKTAENLKLQGVLPQGKYSPPKEKIAYLKQELLRGGITNSDDQDAIIGNLLSESGLNESAVQPGGAGEGIAQWTSKAWKEATLKYINEKRVQAGKKPVSKISDPDVTFEEQVSALLYTPGYGILLNQGHGHNALKKMQNETGLNAKTVSWMDNFETPVFSLSWNKVDPNQKAWNWKYTNGKKTDQKTTYDRSRAQEIAERVRRANSSAAVEGGGPSVAASALGTIAEGGTKVANWTISGVKTIVNSGPAKAVVDAAGNKFNEVKENIEKSIPKTTYSYNTMPLSSIGKEFHDYYYYQQHPGSLPSGMSNIEWQEKVRGITGFYPSSLTDISSKLFLPKPEGVNKQLSVAEGGGSDQSIQNLAKLAGIKTAKALKADEEAKKKEQEIQNREKTNSKNIAKLVIELNQTNSTLVALGDVIRGSHDWRKQKT